MVENMAYAAYAKRIETLVRQDLQSMKITNGNALLVILCDRMRSKATWIVSWIVNIMFSHGARDRFQIHIWIWYFIVFGFYILHRSVDG